jgi:radical SAM protein with 4Fe4S-binding SPASM domain
MTTMLREGIDAVEYVRLLREGVRRMAVPMAGSIDLTNRCNLRCVHCYQGDRRAGPVATTGEMTGDRWVSLLDELAAQGCLSLLLTGGEPLARADFGRIYRHARESGFLVDLFTNGTLIDAAFIELMRELPPNEIEISLYGATRGTYEGITGVPGSFDRCMEGIALVHRHGLPLKLKTMLMRANRHEYHDIRRVADSLGVPFRMDAALFPGGDGDRRPLDQRLEADEAVALEFSDDALSRRWIEYHRTHRPGPASDDLYQCGAGRSNFHIKADGRLVPCLMFEEPAWSLREGGFAAAWSEVRKHVESLRTGAGNACRACPEKLLCGVCPAFFRRETGDEEKRSAFLCALGRCRSKAIHEHACEGG